MRESRGYPALTLPAVAVKAWVPESVGIEIPSPFWFEPVDFADQSWERMATMSTAVEEENIPAVGRHRDVG
jgi:hypothetical protein